MRKLLVLLAALLLLPVFCSAETVEIHEFWMCSPGDVRLPIYPDYSSRIGEGLTKDDFIITYASSSPKVTVKADGAVYIANGVPLLTNFPLEITYTPKVEGVGTKTVFAGRLRTVEAINEITPEKDFYRIRVDETISFVVELNGGSTTLVASVEGDDGVTVDKVSQWGTDSIRVVVTTKKPGPAKVTVKAYNGTTGTIEFDVIGPPTQFKFAKDHFTCYVGEDVDLGLDTGNGPYGLEYFYNFYTQIFRDDEVMPNGYYKNTTGIFSAPQAGEYRIVCSYGDVRGETRVTVLDREDYEEPSDRLPGDANGNGLVNPADAVAILDALANGGALYTDNANVNGDEAINMLDALLILQHAAGWNVTLK
ncbi:MAG: dockerin type I repeat-containing protein [Clostridia bacterium]|nr:dockerin type I repeat-containing protein [Clostridia bacterium]